MGNRTFLKKLTITGLFTLGLIAMAQADPINVALSGTATQSSTYPTSIYSDHRASIAIDGVTGGDAYLGQITHTRSENQPWWQVDLLDMFEIDRIVVWNRTDGVAGGVPARLSNFNVSVLGQNNSIVWAENFFTNGGYPNPSLTIDLPDNISGQIVKVRLNGSDYLSLAEVQVFPVPEPGTMLLLGSGLIGLVGYGRKRLLKK